MKEAIERKSSALNLAWVALIAVLIALCHFAARFPLAFPDFAIQTVAGVYRLPNYNYLYSFAWAPIITYVIWHLFGQTWMGSKVRFVAGVLGFSALTYLLAGAAQLYVLWVLPFGLLTIATSFLFFRKARLLLRSVQFDVSNRRSLVELLAGPLLILMISTVYLQPWSLVLKLPDVTNTALQDLDLRGTLLFKVSFTDTVLSDVDFSGADLNGVKFTNVTMRHVSFAGANLGGVIFENVAMDETNFRGAQLQNSTFKSVSIRNADFQKAWIYQTDFERADLTAANFDDSVVGRTFIQDSKLCGASFQGKDIKVYGWQGSIYDANAKVPGARGSIDGERPRLVESC